MPVSEHQFLHLVAIFLACMTFNITVLFTSGALGHRLGLFVHNTGGLAEKFYLEKYKLDVTPAAWSMYQSIGIYLWQALWLTYAVTCTCRRRESQYLYIAYPVLPPIFYVVYAFALACNISWLLIWDREYMEVALVFVNLLSCTLYICLVVSLRRLHENGYRMLRHGLWKDIWCIRVLVQNGLAMFATWSTVAAMFNFAVVLSYRTGTYPAVASTVSLTLFTIEIFMWLMFDHVVFEKYLRYLFTPYIVLLVSIAGIISDNWDPRNTNAIYTLMLLCLVALVSILKVMLTIWRHRHQPIFNRQPSHTALEADRDFLVYES